ncbi:MAG: hypothetical protein EPO20_01165 [Betaproteobacteria bacterium]|nr:MAG: hypothetical protein EPO20_01165 [Betaproteobacteria bacterium]
MKRALKLLLVCAMLALIPLRGIAAMTGGICAAGDHGGAVQAHADHGHGVQQGDGHNHDCSNCAEHCAGFAFVPHVAPAALPDFSGAEQVVALERFAAGHVPEHLDPPPLAL